MIKKVFTIHDSAVNAYLQPFFLSTEAEAIRAMQTCLLDKNHKFATHPQDYTLFYLCDFDDNNSKFSDHHMLSLGNLVEFQQIIEEPSIPKSDIPELQNRFSLANGG